MTDENEVDVEAIQKEIEETQDNQEIIEDIEEEAEEFDIDAALDTFAPISLEGKISEEAAEAKAIERGWRKDGTDKYGHSISAIEFLERTPLFHKMDLMKGDIKKTEEQLNKIIEQNKLIAKKAIDDKERMLKEFKEEKERLLSSEILDSDDISKLKDIDKKIEETASTEVSDDSEGSNEMVQRYEKAKDTFISENEWYNSNRAMTRLADSLGKEYAENYHKENKRLPAPEDLFAYVLDEVKKDFPEMGNIKRSTKVATRNNRTVATNHKKKKTLNDLPEDQQSIARHVMEAAGLSEDDYMKTYGANA